MVLSKGICGEDNTDNAKYGLGIINQKYFRVFRMRPLDFG